MANVVSIGDFSWQTAIYGGNKPNKPRPPIKSKDTQSTTRNLSAQYMPIDSLTNAITKTTGGFQKKMEKDFKSNLHNQNIKGLKYSKLENHNKKLMKKDASYALKKKINIINILPQAKKDLKIILKDKQMISKLVKKMTDWLSGNNNKTLEIFNVFRNIGQNKCLTYPQFIGTMINLEAPFRMLWLCALTIHLSSQRPGLISEEDMKKLQSDEPTECDICGFGKPAQKIRTGPFGVRQVPVAVKQQVDPVEIQKPSDFTESKDARLKADFMNLYRQLAQSKRKKSWRMLRKKSPEMADVAEKTLRTRDLLVDWRQQVSKIEESEEAGGLTTRSSRLIKKHSIQLKEGKIKIAWPSKGISSSSVKDNTENNMPKSMTKREASKDIGCLGKEKQTLVEIVTRIKTEKKDETVSEYRTTRFKNVSAVVTERFKIDKFPCPRIATVAETMTNKMRTKTGSPTFRRQISYLDIPNVDEDILRAFTRPLPKELFVLIHLRSIIYDHISSCPAHRSLLLTDDNTLTYVADCIKNINDISRANIYISPCRLSFRRTLLPLEKTLRQCGFQGYCKSHPLKLTLYYDFVIIYDFNFK